eukprot:g1199.t1
METVHIHLTAFGPFPGVPVNPTEALMEMVKKDKLGVDSVRMTTHVFRCAALDVDDLSKKIHREESRQGTGKHIWIHMGVHTGSKHLRLEKRAYNCADFRCPDVRGEILKNRAILSNRPSSSYIESDLALETLKRTLSKRESFPVMVSVDAGRYLCNYLFYRTLAFCSDMCAHKCLFLHIPPFHTVSLSDQTRFVIALIREIVQNERSVKVQTVAEEGSSSSVPLSPTTSSSKKSDGMPRSLSSEVIRGIAEMGFGEAVARQAFRAVHTRGLEGNADALLQRAVAWILTNGVDGSSGANSERFEGGEECKLVILVRSDLSMGAGKIAAQSSHAALAACRNASDSRAIRRWTDGGEKIVVLRVANGDEMGRLCASAKREGIAVNVIRDAGRTVVASGTETVCAIGPDLCNRIDRVTGGLRVL